METLYDTLNAVMLSTVQKIDNDSSDWFIQSELGACEFLLQLHRLKKKFMKPDDLVQERLHRECISRFNETETRLQKLNKQMLVAWPLPGLAKVRYEINQILHNFRYNREFAWFGPGETFESSSGDVSVYSKLICNEWTVTENCVPLLKSIIRNNRVFRRIMLERARSVLRDRSESTLKELLSVIRLKSSSAVPKISELLYKLRSEVRKSRERKPDPITFDEQFALTWRLVPGGRFSSVPKDNRKRRPINVEPLGNILVQKAIGRSLKLALKHSGNDLFSGQQDHKELIKDLGLATIDLSDASDSISWKLVQLIFPPSFVKLLNKSRSRHVLVENNGFKRLEKVSSMGNGFTFEILTTILLALARSTGAKVARVYGDDIIISVEQVHELYDLLSHYGFVINRDKSFAEGFVRESCGAFTHNGYYMRSYDFEWLENDLDAVILANKLFTLKKKSVSLMARWFWGDLWQQVSSAFPPSAKGPVPHDGWDEKLSDYVWDEDVDENYVSSGPTQWIEKAYQLPHNSVHRVQVLRVKPVGIDLREVPWVGLRKSRLIHLGKLLRLVSKAPVQRFNVNKTVCESETWYADGRGLLMNRAQYKAARNFERYNESPSCWGKSYNGRGAVRYTDRTILAVESNPVM